MHLVVSGVTLAIYLYIVVLLGRLIFGWAMYFSPDWKPRGVSLVVVEVCYAATDPPVRALRRILPRLQFGHTRVDLGLLALFLACYAVLYLLQFVPGGGGTRGV
jgi:YggT family protein